jgi:hypothetical protein
MKIDEFAGTLSGAALCTATSVAVTRMHRIVLTGILRQRPRPRRAQFYSLSTTIALLRPLESDESGRKTIAMLNWEHALGHVVGNLADEKPHEIEENEKREDFTKPRRHRGFAAAKKLTDDVRYWRSPSSSPRPIRPLRCAAIGRPPRRQNESALPVEKRLLVIGPPAGLISILAR